MTVHVATLTGLVDLENPVAGITLNAMAHGLGKIDRWAGALEVPFSVAQHSVLVMEIFKKLNPLHTREAIYALLHDGHEYLIGDIITPAVRLINLYDDLAEARLTMIKHELDRAIRMAFDIPAPVDVILEWIADADMIAADFEWRALMPAANGPSPYAEATAKARLPIVRPKPLQWMDAADLFRATFVREHLHATEGFA